MKIFIPRVPNTVNINDLMNFSTGLLNRKLHLPFTRMPDIMSCDILLIKDMQLGITEHHGLISIWPDPAGQWFIQHIKNQRLHHKLLYGREYFSRIGRSKTPPPENDRRRRYLEIGKMDAERIHIEGMDQFAQTHIN